MCNQRIHSKLTIVFKMADDGEMPVDFSNKLCMVQIHVQDGQEYGLSFLVVVEDHVVQRQVSDEMRCRERVFAEKPLVQDYGIFWIKP